MSNDSEVVACALAETDAWSAFHPDFLRHSRRLDARLRLVTGTAKWTLWTLTTSFKNKLTVYLRCCENLCVSVARKLTVISNR